MEEYYDDEDVREPIRLTEGLAIRNLIELGGAEFTLEAPDEDPFDIKDFDVDSSFNFDEFQDLINFDCINLDPEKGDANSTPFSLMAEEMTEIISDGGIKKKIKEVGTGIKAPANAVVYCHYACYLEFSEIPFDASHLRSKKPLRFQLGTGAVYPGFDIAVSSMMEGEKAQFLIKPKYAFGVMGCAPRIPPNSTVLADIHLAKIVDCGALCHSEKETDNEPSGKQKFAIVLKKAKSFHLLGNDDFVNKNVNSAIGHYRKAAAIMMNCSLLDDEEEDTYKSLLMKVCTNLAICYNDPKIKLPKRACTACQDAVRTDREKANNNVKLQFNWGKALMLLGEYEQAAEHLKKANRLDPKSKDVIKLLSELEERKKKHLEFEKLTFKRAFGFKDPAVVPETKECKDDRVTPGFRETIRGQLIEFFKSKNSRLELPLGLSLDEKGIVREVCVDLGLNFQEVPRHGMEPRVCILK